jgi:hypothetical protein
MEKGRENIGGGAGEGKEAGHPRFENKKGF